MTEETEEVRKSRRSKKGQVISNKMDKTVVVRVETRMPHPKYGKIVKRAKKYYAHTEDNSVKEGDTVTIMECRPISKLKRWVIVK